MPKTKEREAEKSSKSSSRASAKTSAKSGSSSKSSTRANGASIQAKASSKSSTKVPAVTTKPASGSHAKSAPQAKPAPASSKATTPVVIAKPTSSKSSGKIAVPVKPAKTDRFEKALEKPTANLKTPFNKDELRSWREQLLQRRNEISSDIAGLEKDAMEAEDGHTTPNHIAERGSDADLQDVSLGIAGEEKDIIWQIDRALRKIEEASPLPFGLCEFTKEPISRNRLQLIPWTPLSIEGANYMEEHNLKVEDLLVDG